MLPKLLIQVRSPWLHFILKSSKKEKVAREKFKLLLVMHGPLNSHLISILMLHPIRVISDWKIMWIFWFPQESFILCFSELQISNLQWFETQMFESAKSVILNLEFGSTQSCSRARDPYLILNYSAARLRKELFPKIQTSHTLTAAGADEE